jgi:hypothetical protein
MKRRLDLEHKTLRVGLALRQGRDDAGEFDVGTFERRIEPLRQAVLGAHAGQRGGEHGECDAGRQQALGTGRPNQDRKRHDGGADHQAARRKFGPAQLPGHTTQRCQRPCSASQAPCAAGHAAQCRIARPFASRRTP